MQLGLKLVNPKTLDAHPISYRLIDTPGSISQLKRASLYAFSKADVVLLAFDGSRKIDEQTIRDWTMFAITQVYQYHKHSVMLRSHHSHSLDNVDTDSVLKGEAKPQEKSSYNENQHTFGNSQQHFGVDKTNIQEEERNVSFA